MSTNNTEDLSGEDIVTVDAPQGSQNTRQGIGGAKRKSAVWDYFVFDSNRDKCVCQLKLKDGRMCGSAVVKNTSPMENHLKYIHPTVFNIIDKAKKSRQETTILKKCSSSADQRRQMDISTSFEQARIARGKNYDDDHPRQVEFLRTVKFFFAGTSAPYQYVDDPLFRDMFRASDSKLKLPTRQALSNSVRLLHEDIKAAVKSKLDKINRRISLSADIWSRRGLSSSFLGVTAHFFDEDKKAPGCLMLGMEKFESRHTADRILELLEKLLEQYELSVEHRKILRIVTDNGSNIKKALDDINVTMTIENNKEQCQNLPNDFDTANVDLNFDAEDACIDDDVADYEARETDHFTMFGFQKRLACIDHGLTCAVRNVIDKDQLATEVKKSAFKLIRSINTSHIAVTFILERSDKKLILPPTHRWIFSFIVLERLILLRPAIAELANVNEKIEEVQLSLTTWRRVISLAALLKPFAEFVKELEGDKYVTISRVLPALLAIEASLIEAKAQRHDFAELSVRMRDEIRQRFGYILDPNSTCFEPIYLISTFLDPSFTRILELPEYACLKEAAVSKTKHLVQLLYRNVNGDMADAAISLTDCNVRIDDVVSADPKTLYSELFSRVNRLVETAQEQPSHPSDLEIDEFAYQRCRIVPNEREVQQSPLEFWLTRAQSYPYLYGIALDILSVPATSAAVEREFSQAGLSASLLRSRLSNDNLQAEVMARVNKSLF